MFDLLLAKPDGGRIRQTVETDVMNSDNKFSTWKCLEEFGFMPDPQVISDIRPGLTLDFGNFKLSASCVMNQRFAEVVLFTGAMVTNRTMTEVIFEMPRQVDSREQCAAWIVWNIDSAAADGVFHPARIASFLAMGREHRNRLPWVMEAAAYAARPRCSVARDWAKVALKTLAENLTAVRADSIVEFGFDGAVLRIRAGDKVVALPGEGPAWSKTYGITAENLRLLPKRLMRQIVEVSVWESKLHIGRCCYAGVVDVVGTSTNPTP